MCWLAFFLHTVLQTTFETFLVYLLDHLITDSVSYNEKKLNCTTCLFVSLSIDDGKRESNKQTVDENRYYLTNGLLSLMDENLRDDVRSWLCGASSLLDVQH